MARRVRVVGLAIGVVLLAGMGTGWWAFGQSGQTTNPPALSSAFDRPLVRDLVLVREVERLSQRVDALEAAVKDLQAKQDKGK